MIDVIIPTMWFAKDIVKNLESYASNPKINQIILIDNNKSKRPKSEVLNNPKIKILSYGTNIFVNPAWNEGYNRSTSDIIAFINDDISVYSDVFDMVLEFNPKKGDLIGVNLRGYQNNYKIDDYINTEEEIVDLKYDITKPIGSQAWAFGICMFMTRDTYEVIPSLYKIWYGDDYLAQKAKNVYAINTNKIKGKISETLVKFRDPNHYISKRIELDSRNFIKFDHFKKSKNWNIPFDIVKKYENKRSSLEKDFFKLEYEKAKSATSDINQNLHILYELAQECDTVIEMGVRTGVSTRAFLNTDVKLISFDIQLNDNVKKLFDHAKKIGKNVQYIQADVLNIDIEETDLLFIDTFHVYEQLKKELELHGNKAKKYIAFHDTYTFGLVGEDNRDKKGLLTAIIEFLIKNPHWKFKTFKTNNNGMTVLERT